MEFGTDLHLDLSATAAATARVNFVISGQQPKKLVEFGSKIINDYVPLGLAVIKVCMC